MNKTSCQIAALYQFLPLTDLAAHQKKLNNVASKLNIKGTILLGREGINGTVAGPQLSINHFKTLIQQQLGATKLSYKCSYAEENPFLRLKVKLKNEIVTIGQDNINPNVVVGEYVTPQNWNALISSPDVLTIDTRNDYEYVIGTFKNAINPKTQTFREFPDYIAKHLKQHHQTKVALFCTGGIRCEKATAYMKLTGFEKVYHLEGGILKYLEEIPESDSLWQGECFVFDNRVSVNHQLEPGSYDQCHACRMPIHQKDKEHPHYITGVSCPKCYFSKSESDKKRFRQRQLQCELAKSRNKRHIGARNV